MVPGLRRLLDSGWVKRDERVVLIGSGAGLKYPDTVPVDLAVLEPDASI